MKFKRFFYLFREFLFGAMIVFALLEKTHGAILDFRGNPSETLLQIFRAFSPLLKDSHVLSKEEIEKILDPQTDPAEISLKSLNLLAQAVFKRPDGIERSQLAHSVFNQKFLPFDTPETRNLFRKLGDIDAVTPSGKPFKYILLNGSTIPSMRQRIKSLMEMVQAGTLALTPEIQIVFLTGDRDLFESETAEVLLNPEPLPQDPFWAPPERAQFPKTEYEAAQWLWAQTNLPPELRQASIAFVNAPKKDGKRPDTLGTVEAWIARNPPSGHCLSVSNQPFVFYQEVIIRHVFQKAHLDTKGFTVEDLDTKGFTVEGIGAHAADDILLSLLADNLARTIFVTLR